MLVNFRSLIGATALASLALNAVATDRYVIFGGGPTAHAGQVSIEKNVLWIDQVVGQFQFSDGRILYGAGNEGRIADVSELDANNTEAQRWLPLARLYNVQQHALLHYRTNAISNNSGNLTKESVTNVFREELAQLKSGDSLWLIYSGHGSIDTKADVSRNALRLWGEERLDVNEFAQLLNQAPPHATVRYVLPQCYSGAFVRSMTKNPRHPRIDEVATNRCGFFAVPDDKIAEGCTPGIDAGDYRDYATYFIAAIAGQTRLGQPLTANPDLNGDKKIGLNEAHSYAYTEGFSSDVPRSTSDYYLELWEPWYARWHSFVSLDANNPYWQQAQRLAQKLNIAGENIPAIASHAQAARKRLADQIAAKERAHFDQAEAEEKIRKTLRKHFFLRWANAATPQSASYMQFVREEADEALVWIQQQPEYPQLVEIQDKIASEALETLRLQREEAQYARLLRALRLATIKQNFDRLANKTQKAQYASLTACEAWAPERK